MFQIKENVKLYVLYQGGKNKYRSTFILRSYRLWLGGMVTDTITPDVNKCLPVRLCYFTLLTRLTCVGTNRTF